MKTPDLIEGLVQRAAIEGSVSPVSPVSQRLLIWASFSFAVIGAGLLFLGVRPDWSQAIQSSSFLVETTLILMVTLLAAYGAFSLSSPGREEESWLRYSSLFAIAALAVESFYSDWPRLAGGIDWSWEGTCSLLIIGVGSLPGVLIFRQIRQAAPLRTAWVGALAALASAGVICVGLQLICHDKPALHLLIWHLMPLMALALLGAQLGKRLLSWWK